MKPAIQISLMACTWTAASIAAPVFAHSPASGKDPFHENPVMQTRIGELRFEHGSPTQETVRKLYDEMDFQRASQAYLWGIPAVGLNEWRRAHYDVFGGKSGEMLNYFDFTEKLGILTPNFTTPYIATFIDLKETGPFVVEVPAGLIAGMILDNWQRVLADLGVVGPDMGKGGKYLILPDTGPSRPPATSSWKRQAATCWSDSGSWAKTRRKQSRSWFRRSRPTAGRSTARAKKCLHALLATRTGARCRREEWPTGTA